MAKKSTAKTNDKKIGIWGIRENSTTVNEQAELDVKKSDKKEKGDDKACEEKTAIEELEKKIEEYSNPNERLSEIIEHSDNIEDSLRKELKRVEDIEEELKKEIKETEEKLSTEQKDSFGKIYRHGFGAYWNGMSSGWEN